VVGLEVEHPPNSTASVRVKVPLMSLTVAGLVPPPLAAHGQVKELTVTVKSMELVSHVPLIVPVGLV
jgi:hypothetical protein